MIEGSNSITVSTYSGETYDAELIGYDEPSDGFADGYYVQKLDAGNGKVFVGDAKLDLRYWLAIHAEYGVGYMKVAVSEDGEEFTEVWSDTEGRGQEFNENARTDATIDLGDVTGWETIYVRVSMNRQGGYTCGGVVKSVITAEIAEVPGAEDDEDSKPEDEKPADKPVEDDKPADKPVEDDKPADKPVEDDEEADAPVKVERVPVNSTLDFTGLEKTENAADVADALKELGVVDLSNLIIDDCYNPFVAVKGYAGEGYFVQKLSVGEDTFAEWFSPSTTISSAASP